MEQIPGTAIRLDDLAVIGQGYQPLYFLEQLPDIAGPGKSFKQIDYLRRKSGYLFRETLIGSAEKMLGQRQNILFSFAQRRNNDLH